MREIVPNKQSFALKHAIPEEDPEYCVLYWLTVLSFLPSYDSDSDPVSVMDL